MAEPIQTLPFDRQEAANHSGIDTVVLGSLATTNVWTVEREYDTYDPEQIGGVATEAVSGGDVALDGPQKTRTLSEVRRERVLEALRMTKGEWVTGPELGAAMGEQDLTRQTRREALFATLRSLEAGGTVLERTGATRYRRYRLVEPGIVIPEGLATPEFTESNATVEKHDVERQLSKKLTRWGLKWQDADFFMGQRRLELTALERRCLGLLVANPYGISRVRLRATLQRHETAKKTGVVITEFDVRLALGSVREQIGETEKRSRIEERHVFNGRNRVELLSLSGVL